MLILWISISTVLPSRRFLAGTLIFAMFPMGMLSHSSALLGWTEIHIISGKPFLKFCQPLLEQASCLAAKLNYASRGKCHFIVFTRRLQCVTYCYFESLRNKCWIHKLLGFVFFWGWGCGCPSYDTLLFSVCLLPQGLRKGYCTKL